MNEDILPTIIHPLRLFRKHCNLHAQASFAIIESVMTVDLTVKWSQRQNLSLFGEKLYIFNSLNIQARKEVKSRLLSTVSLRCNCGKVQYEVTAF